MGPESQQKASALLGLREENQLLVLLPLGVWQILLQTLGGVLIYECVSSVDLARDSAFLAIGTVWVLTWGK